MNSPADQPQRLQALDISRSFIVQAPAGSGKTELLTRRFLSLLAVVEKPETILAITFTRKASSEMLSRILKALTRATEDTIPSNTSEREQYYIARKALDRDKEMGWNLLQNPGRLRVCTIDSFCVTLVRQMPFLSRLGAPPAIVEDATELYREAARDTLALLDSTQSWAKHVERTLDYLNNDWGNAEKLLIEMLSRRDQWMQHLSNGRAELEEGLRIAIEDDLARALQLGPKTLEKHLSQLARTAAANLSGSDSPIANLRDMLGYPPAEVEAAPLWQGIAELLLTKGGDWRKSLDKNAGFPPGSAAKSAMLDLIDHCKHLAQWQEALKATRESPPPNYTDDQWNIIESLSTTMNLAAGQLQQVFAKRGAVDFTELLQRALRALENEEGPTDLAYILDGRIEHILMDEFQDTSLSQKKLLSKLMYGWSQGDNRSLFLVGDPMQSIYRFREAEVGIFLDAWQHGLEAIALEPLTLTVNFRSQAGIVDWVNNTFSAIFPKQPDRDWGAVAYAKSEPNKGKLRENAVHTHPFFSDDEDGEADRAVEIACEALSEENTTVAILTRARDHVKQITRKLQAKGQRYQAVELDLLKDRPAVRDLNALLKALLFPADRVAWLSILRAPWCGLTLAELEAIAGNDKKAPVWDLIKNTKRSTRLERVHTVLEHALDNRKRFPLARWLEDTWLALGGAATLPDEAARQDAHRFLEFLDSFDRGSEIANLAEFEKGLEKLYAKPDPSADGRLQVMTIHKAKGLEFDVVILPGLGNKRASDASRLLYWLQRSNHESDSVVVASASEAGAEKDAIVRYVKAVEKKRNLHEEARLLYVAATRAKRELHLIGAVGKDGKAGGSALETLWEAVKDEFQSPKQLNLLTGLQPTAQNRMERFVDGWQIPARAPAIQWDSQQPESSSTEITFDWSGFTLRSVGTVVHRFLERVGQEGLDRWTGPQLDRHRNDIARQLQSLGVAAADIEQNQIRGLEAIQQTLTDERGKWILSNHQEACSEWELTGEFAGELRSIKIDRSFVDENGTRWIIDYKTGWHEGSEKDAFLDNEMERYRKQLESYAALVSAIDSRPIRLGLYFPLVKGWREWGYQRTMTASGQ